MIMHRQMRQPYKYWMRWDVIIEQSLLCGVIVEAERKPPLFMNIKKREKVIIHSIFLRILRDIYRQMVILVITGQIVIKILFLWVVMRMRGDRLQNWRN